MAGRGNSNSLFRFETLSVGVFVTSVQPAAMRRGVCWSLKTADGTSQNTLRPSLDQVIPSWGAGAVRRVQMPPLEAVANSTFPSAVEATASQRRAGALLESHVTPESVEE